MRDAMCADDHDRAGLYFGGAQRRGLGAQPTPGRPGRQIVANLPDVMVVRAASV